MRGLVASLVLTATLSFAQVRKEDGDDLAQRLASEDLRAKAVASVVASGGAVEGLLLKWADNPPAAVNEYKLAIGLADAFGALKTKSAIPFLIRNISIDRTPLGNTWLKSAEVLEDRLASVSALIRIGPDAVLAVIRAYGGRMTVEDRFAAIFVISRLQEAPEAKTFLTNVVGQANLERYWAEDGLKRIEARH